MVDKIVEQIVPATENNISGNVQVATPVSLRDSKAIERERVRVFREKLAAETVPLKYESKHDPVKNQTIVFLRAANDDGSATDSNTRIAATLCAAFGTASSEYTSMMVNGTINAQFSKEADDAEKANATISALIAMQPQDIIEGHLCSRLVTLVNQYNEYMRCAASPDQHLEVRERYINIATKLMRMYNETLDALNKHRRKGEQKVTVQHVNINGGQALVAGQFNQAGEGANQKVKGVPHV